MIIDAVSGAIISGLAVSVFAGIILALLSRRWRNIDKKEETKTEMEKTIARFEKSIWRLNKTVLIMAKIIDDQTEKAHGDLNSSLEDIATELLRESNKS